MTLSDSFDSDSDVVYYQGDVFDLLPTIPPKSIQLILTSPPYNVGKEYEKVVSIDQYVSEQNRIISAIMPLLKDEGSICWQVGHTQDKSGELIPLDILLYPLFKKHGLQLRNRIVWVFGHGYHSRRKFSGRHETILWFTKSEDYYFDLDSVRIPQKYPGKRYYRGEKKGEYSGNPSGKNPGDVWDIPNVKAQHVEKTIHPCQFPFGLAQICIRSMTRPRDWVFDPFAGVATTLVAAVAEGRRAVGAEIFPKYYTTAIERIENAQSGIVRYRPYNKPIYVPKSDSPLLTRREDEGLK